MFGISFPGAVSNTRDVPFAFKCLESASLSVKAPVLSIISALLIQKGV